MDVRGIEVTNQLRSAIRAKLLELGVRYDEELPDYILVMVVNKKTRQQMHEDLNLFLENNTTPFVDWLHDQVLKKLQKVTVAKKKPAREFVPTVIVKQEEERKKKRSQPEEKLKEEPGMEKTKEKCVDKIPEEQIEKPEKITEKPSQSRPESTTPPHSANRTPETPISRSPIVPQPKITENHSDSPEKSSKRLESSISKRSLERDTTPERPEKRLKSSESSKIQKSPENEEKRLKSCVNKPRITSVVSVKTRLGVTSPRKKFDDEEYRRREQRPEKRLYEPRRNNFRGRFEDDVRRNRDEPAKRIKEVEKKTRGEGSIKDRLGTVKSKETGVRNKEIGIRSRIGTATSKFRALGRLGLPKSRNDDFSEEEEEEEGTAVPVKSSIIAVKQDAKQKEGEDEEKEDETKALPSKVIVTPRPLKPLQPVQRRATQSLLLRAVAEANQSVVRQKNPEPILKEKKAVVKRLRTPGTREIGQNLSVHLNATKRLVMEKIQVELTNPDTGINEPPEPYVPRSVTEDQMDVVMSLFQRGDDTQKFLVTLNGYNNNVMKDRNFSDDDERLEMEVNEEDELVLSNPNADSFLQEDDCPEQYLAYDGEEFETSEKIGDIENNENHCSDNNLTVEEVPRKRRKLSPIVYTRSPSPEDKGGVVSSVITGFEKRPPVTPVIITDSREKCRYWPNCTLGTKCAYIHPPVPCSAFPTCKYGDKCAYKHPKCKFGLSCTKLGCIFSHPVQQQCKYHPYCTKPGCTYLHPTVHTPVTAEVARAKFTWRRQD